MMGRTAARPVFARPESSCSGRIASSLIALVESGASMFGTCNMQCAVPPSLPIPSLSPAKRGPGMASGLIPGDAGMVHDAAFSGQGAKRRRGGEESRRLGRMPCCFSYIQMET